MDMENALPNQNPRKIEPFVELDLFTIDPETVQLLGYSFCIQNHTVILNTVDQTSKDKVIVAMLDTEESELIHRITKVLKREIEPVRLNAYEIHKALDIGFGKGRIRDRFRLTLGPVERVSFDPDNKADRHIRDLLGQAISLGAGDVHVECYEDDIDVRFRIDGILHQINNPLNKQNMLQFITRLKILAKLDIAEKRRAQDGRVYANYEKGGDSRSIDFRLSILPGPFGEDAVLRILDSAQPLIGLGHMGMNEEILSDFYGLLKNPEGLLLVTGPTGCGKTTTLYAGLQELNSNRKKILTVEDPIEYLFPKINQKQVSARMGFADYARSFLRQDPDVIMIGEIRDDETAQLGVRAAQTGHLVLSTLHANDAIGAVSRLLTLGIEASLIANSLLGSLSQRLARKICEKCRASVGADFFADQVFESMGREFPLFHGTGCKKCNHHGYRGRTGVFELFVNNGVRADLIASEVPIHQISADVRRSGCLSLFEDTLVKIEAGITTFEEMRRIIPYRIIQQRISEQAQRTSKAARVKPAGL